MNIALALIESPALAIAVLCLGTVYALASKLLSKADRDDRETLDTLVEDVCALQRTVTDLASVDTLVKLEHAIREVQNNQGNRIASVMQDVADIRNKLTNEALKKGLGR